ncbi:putative RNA-binding protein EEED8.10 isoform X2 [Mytilus edulis]|uniref:putative RNA-binding protein EEED8.10 isoform X1 n=2 Tax=Mytilus edulis TaxID=6550 RepID=UPI0039F07C79
MLMTHHFCDQKNSKNPNCNTMKAAKILKAMEEEDNNVDKEEQIDDRFNLSRKIFVGNISYRVTQKRLTKFFSKFGTVDYCYMVKDHIHKRPKGIAFVTFSSTKDLTVALNATEEQLTLDGRLMRVLCAEESSRVKHKEGTVWDSPSLADNVEKLVISDDFADHNDKETSECLSECHINKLCDDTLILIMSMVPWRQRMCLERVCKRWLILAQRSWHKQGSIHFQSVFKRFEGLTDTKLCSVLVRCGVYLRTLDMSASPRLLTDMSMDVIAEHCPNLEVVDLSGMSITDISLRTLAQKCIKLKSICLQRCFHVSDKGLQWLFENCKQIENVNLQGNNNISGNCFQKIGDYCKVLNLSDCSKLTDTGVLKICRHCKQLRELSISNCQLLTDKSLEKISESLTNIATIYIEKTFANVSRDGLMKIAKLSKLRDVHMSQNLVVNDDLLSAIAIGCPFLETLDISCCHRDVTGVGVKALGICSSLTTLDISYLYKVDDESIQVLSRNGRLRCLTARACSGLTDSAFEDLACLCPNLESLDVSGCLDITNHTVTSFLQSPESDQEKTLMLCIGGTSVVEEDLDMHHPYITFCVHDLSQNYLRADTGIILPDPEPDTDSEDDSNSETKPVCVSVVAAGAEMDNGWEESEYNMYYNDDDLLYGDDPLEMERFQFS